jgi:hypothetical protein
MSHLTPLEARELLQMHSGRHGDTSHPKWEFGFLGSLRPYSGLRVENFHEVMACLKILAPELEHGATCDKDLVAAIWGICHLGRSWGVEAGGMLRSNGLISADQVERLDSWINQISYAMFCLLDGCGVEIAFEHYDELEV